METIYSDWTDIDQKTLEQNILKHYALIIHIEVQTNLWHSHIIWEICSEDKSCLNNCLLQNPPEPYRWFLFRVDPSVCLLGWAI